MGNLCTTHVPSQHIRGEGRRSIGLTRVKSQAFRQEHMGLVQLLGQMFFVSTAIDTDQRLPSDVLDLVSSCMIGGVALSSIGKASRQGICDSVRALQDTALGKTGSGIGLFIAIHGEGGKAMDFNYLLSSFPSPLAISAVDDVDLVEQLYHAMAQEFHVLGFNMNLAPIADVCVRSEDSQFLHRSFGSNPRRVAKLCRVLVGAMLTEGIFPVVCNFPGMGGISSETFKGYPVSFDDFIALEQSSLVPYRLLLRTFQGRFGIMTSNCIYPRIENEVASASKEILAYLRQNIGFDGLVLSDTICEEDLMGGHEERPFVEVAIEHVCKLIRAGVNILNFDVDPDIIERIFDGVLEKCDKDLSLRQDVERASARIAHRKRALGILDNPFRPCAFDTEGVLRTEETTRIVKEVAMRSIYLHSDENGHIPVTKSYLSRRPVYLYFPVSLTKVSDDIHQWATTFVVDAFQKRGAQIAGCIECPSIDDPQERWIKFAQDFIPKEPDAFCLIVALPSPTNHCVWTEKETELYRALTARKHSVVLILRNPHLCAALDKSVTMLVSYCLLRSSIVALIDCLFGMGSPGGSLPVDIQTTAQDQRVRHENGTKGVVKVASLGFLGRHDHVEPEVDGAATQFLHESEVGVMPPPDPTASYSPTYGPSTTPHQAAREARRRSLSPTDATTIQLPSLPPPLSLPSDESSYDAEDEATDGSVFDTRTAVPLGV